MVIEDAILFKRQHADAVLFKRQFEGRTCMGIMRVRTPRAMRAAGPSCRYRRSIAMVMRSGEEMRPMMLWHSICSISTSLVTMLKMRPLECMARPCGDSDSTWLCTWCVRDERSLKPACQSAL